MILGLINITHGKEAMKPALSTLGPKPVSWELRLDQNRENFEIS